MPPSLRRRGQPPQQLFHESVSDSDPDEEVEEELEDDVMQDEIRAFAEDDDDDEEEEEDEEDEELGTRTPSSYTSPIPPNFREISTLASWTVSSSKPGCSIPQLRSPSHSLFWQSDGPQPHYLNIHFFKLVRIVGLRLYLDFDADESYTPTRIVFLAGSGNNDLVEWCEMKTDQPRGWMWADFSGVADDESEDGDEDDEELDEDDDEDVDEEGSYHPRRASGAAPALNLDDTMMLDEPSYIPGTQQHQRNLQQDQAHLAAMTGTPSTSSPTLMRGPAGASGAAARSHPHREILDTTSDGGYHQPGSFPPKTWKKKYPILRAHLVQIKILENHQNGKDTHLRGLQIFALDSENDGTGRREVHVSKKGTRKSVGGEKGPGRKSVEGGAGGGLALRGLSKSAWDVEPSIR